MSIDKQKNICSPENPINKISDYLKKHFGEKTVKLAIDGGFTCPNRDGTKSDKGCTFCSSNGSGDFASNISKQMTLLQNKWPKAKYIAYFQNHSNTYADVSILREKFKEALSDNNISGIAIATRPDCFNEDIYKLLDEINQQSFLWVELGLQTIHERTAKEINRCCTLSDYDNAVKKLTSLNIRVVTHLIFGLPNESKKDMLTSVQYVCKDNIFGIKLHMLNIVKGSIMASTHPDYLPFQSIEEYVNLVVDALEVIPPQITIHRMSADAPRPILINPPWSYKKRTILNGILHELKRRNSWQGKFTLQM